MLKVLITIDVETSIGGAFDSPKSLRPVGAEQRIFGKIGGTEYGIPMIMDILEEHNLKGTFFMEPLCSYYFGLDMVKEVCQQILQRGHDLQLHLHPNYQVFKLPDWEQKVKEGILFPDVMADYPFEKQLGIIDQALGILQKCGLSSPLAFRAGCFGLNLATISALRERNILFDSSLNLSYLYGTDFADPTRAFNDLTRINGVWELPITNYHEFRLRSKHRLRHLDICGMSVLEMRRILQVALEKGPTHVTFLLHSFSFLRSYDVQYRKVKPSTIVIKRFQKLCELLANNKKDYETVTFRDLAKDLTSLREGVHRIPFVGNFTSLSRYLVQDLGQWPF